MKTLRILRGAAWVALLLALQGCATVQRPDPRDPLESVNRAVFSFNDAVDAALLKPVAKGYRAVAPQWLRKGVSNFSITWKTPGPASTKRCKAVARKPATA